METCGARTRAGLPCKRRDIYRSGRCKLHGGLSTGPKSVGGRERAMANLRMRHQPEKGLEPHEMFMNVKVERLPSAVSVALSELTHDKISRMPARARHGVPSAPSPANSTRARARLKLIEALRLLPSGPLRTEAESMRTTSLPSFGTTDARAREDDEPILTAKDEFDRYDDLASSYDRYAEL